MKPTIITLTGPACSGKSTLEKALAARGFQSAVSTTTRKPRDGEREGVAYYFVDERQFLQMGCDNQFIESVEFNGNRYGVTAAEIARISAMDKPVTVVCEPHGQAQIRMYAEQHGWNLTSVFIDAPIEVITARYLSRFLLDSSSSHGKDTIGIYANRLKTLINQELKWADEKDAYDFYVPEFTAISEEEVLTSIMWLVFHNAK